MEKHQQEVEIAEERVAILEQLRAHLHLSQGELELAWLSFPFIKLVLFAFHVCSGTLGWFERFLEDLKVGLGRRHVNVEAFDHCQ